MIDKKIYTQEIDTPIGQLLIGVFNHQLCLCDTKQNKHLKQNMHRIKRHLKAEYRKIETISNEKAQVGMENDNVTKADFQEASTMENDNVTKADFQEASTILSQVHQELREYFAGKRQTFDIPLLPCGTAFQKSVWQALRSIPYGETFTYGQIAEQIAHPKAVRAVAQAIGRNALCILIPCHRVIGADGSLTGFAGGLEAKKLLLGIEMQKDNNKEAMH